MQDIIRPVKKPSGCLNATGWVLTIGSLLFIILCIAMIIEGERHMDELRAEYTASTKEYEEKMEAYVADSAHLHAEYNRIAAAIEEAQSKGDSTLVEALTDSLKLYDEPLFERRGAIGVNIGAAFFVFFALCALVPLALGIVLLVLFWHRRRKYRQYIREL
jgi:C4-dicarboxylate-specific signal transduction histidine kinase